MIGFGNLICERKLIIERLFWEMETGSFKIFLIFENWQNKMESSRIQTYSKFTSGSVCFDEKVREPSIMPIDRRMRQQVVDRFWEDLRKPNEYKKQHSRSVPVSMRLGLVSTSKLPRLRERETFYFFGRCYFPENCDLLKNTIVRFSNTLGNISMYNFSLKTQQDQFNGWYFVNIRDGSWKKNQAHAVWRLAILALLIRKFYKILTNI